jgi:hypothetical protein
VHGVIAFLWDWHHADRTSDAKNMLPRHCELSQRFNRLTNGGYGVAAGELVWLDRASVVMWTGKAFTAGSGVLPC